MVLLALSVYVTSSTSATVVHPINVPALVEASDLVVVGRVTSVQEQGSLTIDTPAGPALARGFLAGLQTDQVLKGNIESQNVYFEFLIPDVPSGYGTATQGQYGIFLLQKASNSRFKPSDPLYPLLPAVPGGLLSSGSPIDQVARKLGEVLAYNGSREFDISSALNALVSIPADSATQALRSALKTSSGDLQLDIASKLVARNDISGLDVVAKALLHQANSHGYLHMKLAGSLAGLKDPRSIPTLKRLLQTNDPEITRSVAIALRQTRSQEALGPLSELLGNGEQQVRYYAVVGMGEITQQDEWSPAFDEFQSHESKYLTYWRDWAQANLPAESRR